MGIPRRVEVPIERRLSDLELRAEREELDLKGVDGPAVAFRIAAPVVATT